MRSIATLLAATAALFVLFAAAVAPAQQVPAATPFQTMPYSPSLDMTSLDKSVAPCVDFYRYSCGGWMKKNPIPPDQASWSVYGKLANENEQFLWGILEADAKASDRTPVQQKIGDYFAACMDTAAIDKRGFTSIAPELATIDNLADRKALIAYLPRLQQQGMGTFFFRAGPSQDPADSNQ